MKYKLNEMNIDAVSKEVDAYRARRKMENKDRVKTRLAVEEALLNSSIISVNIPKRQGTTL